MNTITKNEIVNIVKAKQENYENKFFEIKALIIETTYEVLDNLLAHYAVAGQNAFTLNSQDIVKTVKDEMVVTDIFPEYCSNPSTIVFSDIEWEAEIIGAMMNYALDSEFEISGQQTVDGTYSLSISLD